MKNVFGIVVGFTIAFAPTALALLASAYLSKRSVEEWRLLAWVPSAPVVFFWGFLVVYMLRDPTANVIWPIPLVAAIVLSAALFGLFFMGRKLSRSNAPRRPWQH